MKESKIPHALEPAKPSETPRLALRRFPSFPPNRSMTTSLTYGKATTCLLDSATLLQPQSKRALPTNEIAAQVRAQLGQPLHYPPLAQATIPGDRVAVAIGQGMPQQLHVIDGALLALRDAGVEDQLITVLLPAGSTHVESLQSELANLGHPDCCLQAHDPDDEKAHTFLGVTRAGQALRVNRTLCDADLVLSLAVTQNEPGDSHSSFRGIFPTYSDTETISRYSALEVEQSDETATNSFSEVEECGHLLGMGLLAQVVPAPGGEVATVLAGDPASVAKAAQAEYRQIWNCETPCRGNLVIAALTGDACQQTWQNVSHAIAAAEAVLEVGGSIAICTELAEPLGRSLGHLAGNNEDPQVIEREILGEPSADSGPAIRLCRALERGTIYLRSQLPSPVVESLGITPLESDSELERLAQSHRPCLVLEEAQRLLPTLAQNEA